MMRSVGSFGTPALPLPQAKIKNQTPQKQIQFSGIKETEWGNLTIGYDESYFRDKHLKVAKENVSAPINVPKDTKFLLGSQGEVYIFAAVGKNFKKIFYSEDASLNRAKVLMEEAAQYLKKKFPQFS